MPDPIVRTRVPRSWRRSPLRLTNAVLVAFVGLLVPYAQVHAEPPPAFNDSIHIAAVYHRQLSLLPARYQDQPETAAYEFRRLTARALSDQRTIDVQPCFARWWAHEYMGLKLTALAHGLRDRPDVSDAEADIIERLGTQMWMEAMALVPDSAAACGAAVQPGSLSNSHTTTD